MVNQQAILNELLEAVPPYVNFYQYPSLRPLPPSELSPYERLALGEDVPGSPTYTIFISIPFCRVRCHSCPFFRGFLPMGEGADGRFNAYVDAVGRSIELFGLSERFNNRECGAIYFGGGTASLLTTAHVADLMVTLRNFVTLTQDVEITLEGNPREFNSDYFARIREEGITRVSLGYQSRKAEILKRVLNSPHSADQSVAALKAAVGTDFHSVNIDLLYRLPDQTFADWQYDVEEVINYRPTNITLNEYVVHSGSNTEKLIKRGLLGMAPDRATAHDWYLWAREVLQTSGYSERRKGSFFLPGHNPRYATLSYTDGCEIVGVGAGAYGYLNSVQYRTGNSADVYTARILGTEFPIVDELSQPATGRHQMERFVLFSLFEMQIDRREFRRRFQRDLIEVFEPQLTALESAGLVVVNSEKVYLTDLGVQWNDAVRYQFRSEAYKQNGET